MSEGVLIAIITSGLSLVGIIITCIVTSLSNNKKIVGAISKENTEMINNLKLEVTSYHASTDEKIKELTREVREHNNFAKRMPVVENEIKHIEEEIREYHKK